METLWVGSITRPVNQVNLSALVMFSMLDHYSRRNEDQERVVGALLGKHSPGGAVEVTACFPIPHAELDDALSVDMEFHKMMLSLHARVNTKEQIVGWYSTSPDVPPTSAVVNEFFQQEVACPVLVSIDPTLSAGPSSTQIPVQAYISEPISLGGKMLGCQFHQIPLTMDTSSLEVLTDCVGHKKPDSDSQSVMGDYKRLQKQVKEVNIMLQKVSAYVDSVVAGKTTPDEKIGVLIDKAINSLPHIDAPEMQQVVDNNVQDLLMVSYLINLTRAQLAIADRLEAAQK